MSPVLRIGALGGALAAMTFAAFAGTNRRSLQTHEVVMGQELLVTAAEVVDSPLATYPGPWSFGHLVEQAFGEEKAPEVVAEWLESWADGQPATSRGQGFPPKVVESPIPRREGLREMLIKPWQVRDGYDRKSEKPWRPDFRHAPFQLLAIVNRMDLSAPLASFLDRSSTPAPVAGYYSGVRGLDSSGGEGRFIFAATDQSGHPLAGGATFILEYGLDTGSSYEVLIDWAMVWHHLGEHEDVDAAFRGDLARVTRLFTDRRERSSGAGIPGGRFPVAGSPGAGFTAREPADRLEKPLLDRLKERSSRGITQLLRIRTNDGVFGEEREFREFTNSLNNGLVAAPLAGTPREVFFRKGTRENRFLARWLRGHHGKKVTPVTMRDRVGNRVPTSFALPQFFSTGGNLMPVVARVAPVPGNDKNYHWDTYSRNEDAFRRAFSIQTCCGCHCGDTNTAFFHVAPRDPGQAAPLSKFLRTDRSRWGTKDPANRQNYLSAEMEERRELFEALLNPNLTHRQHKKIKNSRRGNAH